MRVFLGLLLLALSALAVSAQTVVNPDATNTFHFTDGNGATWTVTSNGQQSTNPTLNMTVGITYFISIEFNTVALNHPFGLNTDIANKAVSEMGLVNVNGTCGGTASPGYTFANTVAPFCVLSFTPNVNTSTNLYYHCSVHQGMVGKIQVNAAGAATPAPTTNTTTAPPTATPAPTVITGGSIAADATTNIFHITSGTNSGSLIGWVFTSNGQQYVNPTLNMTAGITYSFSIEFDTTTSSPPHPFGLNSQSSSTVADTTLGLVNTTVCGTAANGFQATGPAATQKCVVSFTPAKAATLYYHCLYHGNMFGPIQVLGASGSTTSPPTTPHGSASALVPGVAAVFAAFAAFAAL